MSITSIGIVAIFDMLRLYVARGNILNGLKHSPGVDVVWRKRRRTFRDQSLITRRGLQNGKVSGLKLLCCHPSRQDLTF